jgi:serine/threonine protein phosphatase PrpC
VERLVTAGPCTACGEVLVEGARFCEACGVAANGSTPAAHEPGAPESAADSAAADAESAGAESGAPPDPEPDPAAGAEGAAFGPCVKCGAEVADDGWCTSCGHRAIEEVTVDDRGPMAYATHRGRRHHRNEDAAALATTAEGWPVLVVSDGVSISPNPHLASAAAVAAAAGRLAGRPFGGEDDLVAAVADAHAAACAVPATGDPHWTDDGTHAACTLVVAVAAGPRVFVANVGDARAHLVCAGADAWTATQLSTDDSLAAQAVAQGIDVEVALNLPGGHAITAWLGADAPEPHPHLAAVDAAPGDVMLVCSDGLWNYAPTDAAMGGLLAAELPDPGGSLGPLGEPCERLVSWAIDQGGMDNICVALAPVPAAAPDGPERDDARDESRDEEDET